MNKSIALIPLLALAGCVPYPHMAESSPAVYGRVVNARTHAPIAGARVMIRDQPATAVKSDPAGNFAMRAQHHLNLWVIPGICGIVEGPGGSEYLNEIEVSRDGYVTKQLRAGSNYVPGGAVIPMNDILLKPAPTSR